MEYRIRLCPACGYDFEIKYRRDQEACSPECAQILQRERRPPVAIKTKCIECKKTFVADCQRAFCGRECFYAWQKANQKFHVIAEAKVDMEAETNGACLRLKGPCKFTTCRCHLGSPDVGTMMKRRIPVVPPSMCAIKEAGKTAHTLEQIAVILGITRERARQIEQRALRKIRAMETA